MNAKVYTKILIAKISKQNSKRVTAQFKCSLSKE